MPKKTNLMKKFELVGYPPGRIKDWVSSLASDSIDVGKFPVSGDHHSRRTCGINSRLALLGLRHLGLDFVLDTKSFLARSTDAVEEYFCGDWWRDDEDSCIHMDKSKRNPERDWSGAFSRSLTLLLLDEDWDRTARVCAWVDADLPAYPVGFSNDPEDEVIYLYQIMAAALRPEPMPGIESLQEVLRKCRKKQPKLLYKAWDAACRGDQSEFNESFLKSVEAFAGRRREHDYPLDYIAVFQSTVGMAAKRIGMANPELPPELQAFVMTRKSIGLED